MSEVPSLYSLPLFSTSGFPKSSYVYHKERSYQCSNCIKVSPEIFKELEISNEAVQNDTEEINDKTIQNIEKSKQNVRPLKEETQQEIIKKRIDGLEEKFEELLIKTSQIEIRNDLRNLSYAGVTKQENTTSSSIELKTEDEKREERKIRANAYNIIVHGVEESTNEEPNELKIEVYRKCYNG